MMHYYRRIFFVCVLIFIGLILHFSGIACYFSLEQIQHHATKMLSFVHEHYGMSVLIYCASFIGATVLAIPITILLTILGGYLFGWLPAVVFVTVSATMGSMALFLLVRYLCGDLVHRLLWQHVDRLHYEIEKRGYSYILMLQLLPITPTPLITIAAGLSPISCWTFMWSTFIGLIPGTVLYAIAGQQLINIHSINDILSWPMIAVLFLLAFLSLLVPYALHYMGFVSPRK